MRLISVHDISGKEILGKTIFDDDGRILLTAGCELHEAYTGKLLDMGIDEIYVEDSISEGITVGDCVSRETRNEARRIISIEGKRLATKKEINIMEIYKVVDLIVNDILYGRETLINLKDLRVKDDYTFAHSVNTAILSAVICKKMEFPYDRMNNVVTGALLHDIGKLFIPKELISRPHTKLSKCELDIYKTHAQIGYDLLKGNIEINPTIRVAILMHHERLDGSGFPEGLRVDKIHESAKICAICNTFDNLLNAPDNSGVLCTTDAVEYLQSCAGVYFDKKIVELFLKLVPIYPVGSIVLLNSGLIGIVMKNNESSLLRPVVRAFYDGRSRTKINNSEIDLMKDLSIKILRELKSSVLKDITC